MCLYVFGIGDTITHVIQKENTQLHLFLYIFVFWFSNECLQFPVSPLKKYREREREEIFFDLKSNEIAKCPPNKTGYEECCFLAFDFVFSLVVLRFAPVLASFFILIQFSTERNVEKLLAFERRREEKCFECCYAIRRFNGITFHTSILV